MGLFANRLTQRINKTLAIPALCCCIIASPAGAASVTSLIIFGDSTVDAGSLQALGANLSPPFDPTPASAGYFDGRFSNGPNYADRLNERLFGELSNSFLAGGGNYAFGGAAIITDVFGGAFDIPNEIPDLTDQIDIYLGARAGAADPDALHLINFGINDLVAAAFGLIAPDAFISQAIATISNQIGRLLDAGAQHIMIANTPRVVINEIDKIAGETGVSIAAMDAYNAALDDLILSLAAANLGVDILLFDIDSVMTDIFDNQSTFGLDPALFSERCILEPAAIPDCTGYFWFDTAPHPSAAVHDAIASSAIALVAPTEIPLPAAFWIFGAGLLSLRRAAGSAGRREG